MLVIIGIALLATLIAVRYHRARQPIRANFTYRNRTVRDLRGVGLNHRRNAR